MKTLSKIKLNQFSKDELEQRALNALRGGNSCACIACFCVCAGSNYPEDSTSSLREPRENAVHSEDGGSYTY